MSTPTRDDAPSAATGVPEWTIGDRIRKARRHADMSQQELADAIGITVNRLGNWEAGYNKPGDVIAVARAIARVTGVRADWIAGLYSEQPEDGGGLGPNRRFSCSSRAPRVTRVTSESPRTRLHRPDRVSVAAS